MLLSSRSLKNAMTWKGMKPRNMHVWFSGMGRGSVSIGWPPADPILIVRSYSVYFSEHQREGFERFRGELSPNTLSVTVDGLKENTGYCFRVDTNTVDSRTYMSNITCFAKTAGAPPSLEGISRFVDTQIKESGPLGITIRELEDAIDSSTYLEESIYFDVSLYAMMHYLKGKVTMENGRYVWLTDDPSEDDAPLIRMVVSEDDSSENDEFDE